MCRSGVGGRPRVVHHVVGQHHVLGCHLLARPSVVAPGARCPLAGARVLLAVGTWGSVGSVLGQVLGQRLSSHGVDEGLRWSGSRRRRWVGHVGRAAAAAWVLGRGGLCGLGDGAGGVRRVGLVGR